MKNGYFCTNQDGTPFVAGVWPGRVHFPDMLNPEARAWFGSQYKMCIRDSIDSNIRKAIRLGADPAVAVKMATLVPAQYFGFKQRGAVAPGYRADLVVVSDLESFMVEQVYKNGTLLAEHGKTLKPAPLDIDRVRFSHVMDSFDLDEITLQDVYKRQVLE